MPFTNGELQGNHVLLYIESDSVADTYAQSCLLELTGEVNRTKNRSEYVTRDCTQPDKAAVTKRRLQSTGASITGTAHIKDLTVQTRLEAWHGNDSEKNIQLRFHEALADGTIGDEVFRYTGAAKLTLGNLPMAYDQPLVRSVTLDIEGDLVFDDLAE